MNKAPLPKVCETRARLYKGKPGLRWLILRLLRQRGTQTTTQLAFDLQVPLPNVNHMLVRMRDAGIVECAGKAKQIERGRPINIWKLRPEKP